MIYSNPKKKHVMKKTTTTNTQTKKKLGSKNHGTKHIRQIFYLYKVKHKTIISVTLPCNQILTASFSKYWHIALTIQKL